MEQLLSLQNIQKSYGTASVLRGIDLTLHTGDYLAIMGRSGSGKSTLLHILGAMETADIGCYRFRGTDIAGGTAHVRAAFRNAEIGFVFQQFHLISSLSVMENIAMPLGYRGVSRAGRIRAAEEALNAVGLSAKRNMSVTTLSGGEQQRIAIARAIVGKPSLLLADEPTGNLDAENAAQIISLIDRLNAAGTTVILVTHDRDIAAHAKRRLLMENGRLREDNG